MSLTAHIRGFASGEDGSVVIDWAILTAATIGISAFMFDGVAGSIEALAYDIEATLTSITVPTTFAAYQDLN
ncbi:hypothetical protein [Jannaschia sp. 2305UL9-9]|uniref:hypothetical protein n=1 Tax=Jannaschia sp. 2305UL9-9 TaxID=3121638 RepID=UPI003527DD6B